MTPSIVISIICLAICLLCFFVFHWYIKRKTAAGRLLSDYRAEINRMIADIDAATDRDMRLVEERINILRKLLENTDKQLEERKINLEKIIDDTDRRISVYVRELNRSKEGEAMYTSLGMGIRAALNSQPNPPENQPEKKRTGSKNEKPKPKIKKNEIKNGELTNKTEETEAGKNPVKLNTKALIAQMSAQGLSPAEIASTLELSHSEVDLALNLLYPAKEQP